MVKNPKTDEVPDGYNEVSIDFHQFINDGDTLEGELVDKDEIIIRDNPVGKYTLKQADGKRVAFLGGVQIDPIMADIDVGTQMMIKYLGREPTTGGNKVKTFKVYTK